MPDKTFYQIAFCFLSSLPFICRSALATNTGAVMPDYLRCEYRVNPIGIDNTSPRLSWTLQSSQRGQNQTAYRILIASSSEKLQLDQGDLWDSGKVNSAETTAITYAGTPLTSGLDCFWKVKAWDNSGNESPWSAPAHWSMGLLQANDWEAQWIGFDPADAIPSLPPAMSRANWIWSHTNANISAAPGLRYFRRSFQLPAGQQISQAHCYITADNAYELYLNGHYLKSGSDHTVISSVTLSEFLQSRTNTLAVQVENQGDSSNPAGLLAAIVIEFTNNETLEIVSDNQWRTNSQEITNWKTISFDDSNWANTVSLGLYGMSPWQQTKMPQLPPARYLRNAYQLADKPIKKARIYASALGIYQLYMNGRRISQDYFSPGWEDYTKRIYYRTYDVTSVLQSGDNAIGAVLADGWFAGYVGYAGQRNHYGQYLRLLCQLSIEYQDGTTQTIASGPDWKGSLGPIRQADFLKGESYDARRELPGWNTPGCDQSHWQPVTTGRPEIQPTVQAAVSEPVVVFEEVHPVAITQPVPGQYVFNMGQNFAGVVRIQVQGQPGQTIQLRHAERLNPDGTIYTANLRSATSTDTYICKGEGIETWQPYFTFHGFQYVELTGLDYQPALDTIVGLALSSNTPTVGTFECSDPMVNKLQSNAVWTQRMNFIDIPTDCPQRDERLGWTGDAQVYINTACYHNDVQAFFTKWLVDLTDAQRSDGQFPTVAPLKVSGSDGGPAWADAGIICPWTIYKMYGDTQILATHYEAMKKFITFCHNRCTVDLLPPASFHCFGDWLNINDNTPADVIYMAYFAHSTDLMARIAEALGQTADAASYRQLFEQIKASFNAAYVDTSGVIKGDTQTAYVMAIAYDLLDNTKLELAAGHLVRRIKECDWHLATGFVGTKDLMLALAKIGRNDVAYRLLHNDTFPSWGYSIKYGATSIWERWNGWTPEQGFADPGMNSFAHYSFGAVCQWIFENIGGIQTDGPAFKHIVLKPQPGGTLTYAKTSFQSIRGLIQTDWQLDGPVFQCQLSIPPNTTATLYIPTDNASSVTESNIPATQAAGVTFIEFKNGYAIYSLMSGAYHFQSRLSWAILPWTSDADATISAGKVYTHKVNLHTDESQTTIVNGVSFENDNNRAGSNWSLVTAPLTHTRTYDIQITGDGAALVRNFFYYEPAQLKLTGLIPGRQYCLTHYTRGFGDPGERYVNITSSIDNSTSLFDQNFFGNGNGALFRYTYIAPASGQLTLTYQAVNPADTWHHYAFTNEEVIPVYLDPAPLPGAEIEIDSNLSWTLNGSLSDPQYRLILATNPNLSNPVTDVSGLTDNRYTPSLNAGTDYYWQVTILKDDTIVYTSPIWQFTTLTAPPDAEKVLQWSFNETRGAVAYQSVPASIGDGTLIGFNDPDSPSVHQPGLAGNALLLNGADEYVDISSAHNALPIAEGQSFSISGYFRTYGNYGPLFSMRNSNTETPIIDITLGADGVQNQPGKVCLLVRENNGYMSYINSGQNVNDGQWHNLIVTRHDNIWTLYLDGNVRATMSGSATGALTPNWLAIGSSIEWLSANWQPNYNHYRFFKGLVDEFTVWQGVLQPHQRTQLQALITAPQDINSDSIIDSLDLNTMADQWLTNQIIPAQSSILEDMEAYNATAISYSDYWLNPAESGYGNTDLAIVHDSAAGQALQWNFNFNGNQYAKCNFRLRDRRTDLAPFNRLQIRLKKPASNPGDTLLLDLYDGRSNIDPISSGLYYKGRASFDLSNLPANQWTTLQAEIPYDFANGFPETCHDLYQFDLFIGETDRTGSGTLLIDTITLINDAPDCFPAVDSLQPDLNDDCIVNLLDYLLLSQVWE